LDFKYPLFLKELNTLDVRQPADNRGVSPFAQALINSKFNEIWLIKNE